MLERTLCSWVVFENILGFIRADLLIVDFKHYVEIKSVYVLDKFLEFVHINGLGMFSKFLP